MRAGPILWYRDFMERRYGGRLFRIPVDLGAGCPHREAGGGCSFCPPHGGRAVQTAGCVLDEDQVERAMEFARRRYGARRFMLYFQAYTPTFNLDAEGRARFMRVLGMHAFEALTVATRPDCLPEDTLDFVEELGREIETWVELGVQSTHDKTLRRIHRGHDWGASVRAVEALHGRGISVAAHVILGLPGETIGDVEHTAERLARLPLRAVKLHNLHVIRGAGLAREFDREPFHTLGPLEYAEWVIGFLRRIPADWAVIRLTTDTPPDELLAPCWEMSKGRFMELVERLMVLRECRQGDLVPGGGSAAGKDEDADSVPRAVPTEDGSVTFYSEAYREHYHMRAGALFEAERKYVAASGLEARLKAGPVRLLDVCFGLGYNSLCAAGHAERLGGHGLEIVALELDRRMVRHAAGHVVAPTPWPFDWGAWLAALHGEGRVSGEHCRMEIRWGDARYLAGLLEEASFDVVFLDPFSTQRNSELWTLDFFGLLRRAIKPDGVLVTYCAALPVRGGLLRAGFHIGSTAPAGRERGGTLASPDVSRVEREVPEEEMRLLLETPRGWPYRDPALQWCNSEILRKRQETMAAG